MYVVKFGGSAITDKRRPYTYRRGRVAKIASLLRGVRAVLIHGAGSFAHPHVKSFGLTPVGIAYTKASLRRLTSYVVEELLEAGVPALPMEPSELFWGRHLTRPEVVAHALERGLYPLLHGDVVPSDEGYVVISGDDIAVELTRHFKPKAVVFLMEVDGIYTAPPGAVGAEKIRKITRGLEVEGTAGIDVTGGVRKKVESGLEIAKMGVPAYYCSIDDSKSLSSIISGGGEVDCTYVEPYTTITP
ncbi:MAG: isopentenyl phosphate kinase [Pyrobaculum sp.]